jgi:hypothetical protein
VLFEAGGSIIASLQPEVERTRMSKIIPIILLWAALALPPADAGGQAAPPSTDIYVVALSGRAGSLGAGGPVNATNREGYDNQPMFLRDGSGFFYTSIREDGQADIYRYDFSSRSSFRVTDTKESEYSATPTPDGKSLSVVRVEADSTQRL